MIFVAAFLAPMVLAAIGLRRWLFPDAEPEVARLVVAVLTVAGIVVTAEVLGAIGLFRRWPLAIGYVVVGGGIATLASRHAGAAPPTPTLRLRWPTLTEAAGAAAFAAGAAMWASRTRSALASGTLAFDSIGYHLPWAARFFQEGSVWPVHYVVYGLSTNFDPAGSELLHGLGMTAFERDLLSPLLSVGWLLIVLLAALAADSEPAHRGTAVAGVALFAALPVVWSTQAGTALSDLPCLALLLASVVLLRRSDLSPSYVTVAAVAAGLAISMKLTAAVPVFVLTVGLAVIAPRAMRRTVMFHWCAALALSGSFWMLRNLFAIGNPIPQLDLGVGALRLPRPELANQALHFATGRYLLDAAVLRRTILPAMVDAFGPLWLIVLGIPFVVAVAALISRRQSSIDRVLAAAVLAAFVAYAVTPGTALGPLGHPVRRLVNVNTRVMLAGPLIGWMMLGPWLTQFGRGRRCLFGVVLGILVATVGTLAFGDRFLDVSAGNAPGRKTAAFAAVAAAATILASLCIRGRPTRPVRWAGVAAAGALTLAGAMYVNHLSPTYYQNWFRRDAGPPTLTYERAQTIHGQRIATNLLGSYPLNNVDLSNHVDTIGHRGPHGTFDVPRDCAEWRRALRDERYRYVAVAPYLRKGPPPRELDWTLGMAGAQVIAQREGVLMVSLSLPPDPDACAG